MKKIENMEARLVALDSAVRDFNVATSDVYADVKHFLKLAEDHKRRINHSTGALLRQAADLSVAVSELFELMSAFLYHAKNTSKPLGASASDGTASAKANGACGAIGSTNGASVGASDTDGEASAETL